jgi:ubiquinone/menaquinone biosynthesis C-methylase UbiE
MTGITAHDRNTGPFGNVYDKYGSRNPVARYLMSAFLRNVVDLARGVEHGQILEVGCGEGHLSRHLVKHLEPGLQSYLASDLEVGRSSCGEDRRLTFVQADACELPYDDDSFDLVVCCEVLEHLQRPEMALAEARRVARRAVLVSTPWEPMWRILNVARGRYLRDLGNTPGHIQHFGRSELLQLCALHLDVLAIRKPLPWTIVLGTPKK